MAFLLRSRRLLDGRKPARLDHQLLQATLAAARPSRVGGGDRAAEREAGGEPLVEIVTGGPDWRRASARQRGCFNRAEAGRDRNDA
ncbi:MAG: hypothetical protein AB7H79_05365 [Sphingomonas sp.]